jgi:uncharacterized protein YacL (UPF0231 family)
MKKVIRLTESDLTRLVRRVIQEQTSQTNYQEIANYLYNSMKGLSDSEDAENVKLIIVNKIKNKNDWEGVKKAFGVRDGENLEQWIQGELRLNINDIMSMVNKNDSTFKKEDSMYNVGSKIPLITNRQLIMARAYQYASVMGDKRELELDLKDCVVIRRTKDKIVVKASDIMYYDTDSYTMGKEIPKPKYMSNVCVEIPFSDIIEWRGNSLQIEWLSPFVKEYIVPCSTIG